VAVAVLAAAIGPLVAPYSPEQFHITARFRGPARTSGSAPTSSAAIS
jgi:hypothetical protein